jgi:uncharacterized protein (DUF2062 family)
MSRRLARAFTERFRQLEQELPALAPLVRRLAHPALWALNRRSVALGFAVGLFCGLIPGPLQMLGAAVVATWLKCNFPVAVVTTLYTNPLTIVPLYLLAYQLGALLLGAPGLNHLPPPPDWQWAHPWDSAFAFGAWLQALGMPLVLGVPTLALLLAVAGYTVLRLAWSVYLRRAWAARKRGAV